jgi:ferritin-like metal-binding protein YciE
MSTQHTTADLKNEIEKMEEEKEQIIKRLERVKKRVGPHLKKTFLRTTGDFYGFFLN